MRFQFLFESFLSTFCFGHLLEIRRVLNFLTFPSNIAFEEFFLGSQFSFRENGVLAENKFCSEASGPSNERF